MKHFAFLFAAFTLCLGLASPSNAVAQEVLHRPQLSAKEIEPTLRTDWYGMYLQGKKIGNFKSFREKKAATIVDAFTMHMKLLSFGKKAELQIEQSITFEGKPPYRMLHGTFTQGDGGVLVKVSVQRNEKGFRHVVDAAGQKQTREVADLDYTLADAMASEAWMKAGPKVGDSILGKDLDIKEWRDDQTKYVIKAIKNSLVSGVEVKFLEVESVSKREMLKFLSRHDAEGKLLEGNFAVFNLRLETEAQAKNTEYSLDLFVLGMAKIDRPIGKTDFLKELILECDGKEGAVFEDGPRQTVVVKDGGKSRVIKLGKAHGKETKVTVKEHADGLAETTEYPISNARIKALAQKAVGEARTPEEKVRRIVAFVHGYIKPHLSATLPNIHDLIDQKKGDCKCYALLTTNLCRAVGVPAREVSGLLYMDDDVKAFGGHAWNEVALNGVWVPVDASRGEVEVDAGHICFGSEQRATQGLLNSLGKLSFRVVEFKTTR